MSRRNSRGFSPRGNSGRSFSNKGSNRRGNNKIKYMKIDPNVLIQPARPREEVSYEPKHTFADFEVHPQLAAAIKDKGYVKPTPIQDQVIPTIMEGRDVIGLAATGTGKTAAFLIPLINKVATNKNKRVLIIAPTRELAVQIKDEGRSFTKELGTYFSLVIGGVSAYKQIKQLQKRPEFVVGTPGRIKDLADRGDLKLHEFDSIVLDEVDRMLDMGFIHDMRAIIQQLPRKRHSLFFSATMTDGGKRVAQEFLQDPITVQVESRKTSENVAQDIVRVQGRDKLELLHDMLSQPEFEKVLVFGRTKHGVNKLTEKLNSMGHKAAAIHGNKSQNQRQRALDAFKQDRVNVLLATDVASRGIDIDQVSHVINYELPETYDDYIHRIGRTGRHDQTGVALTFID